MKYIKLFEEFIAEATMHTVSGTSGRTITTLDDNKYELTKEIKGAKIGDYANVVLPKGTIITNLPGGVMAKHAELKAKYCTGYKAEQWNENYGVRILSIPEIIHEIEKNGKVLESEDVLDEAAESAKDHEVAVKLVAKLVKENPTKFKQLLTKLPDNYGTADVDALTTESEDYADLNESALLTAVILLQAAAVAGQFALLSNKLDFHPIDDLKDWWNEHKRDTTVNKILAKLKNDPEVIDFLNLPKNQQEGKWKKFIEPKLSADEIKYLNSVSRDRVKAGKITN